MCVCVCVCVCVWNGAFQCTLGDVTSSMLGRERGEEGGEEGGTLRMGGGVEAKTCSHIVSDVINIYSLSIKLLNPSTNRERWGREGHTHRANRGREGEMRERERECERTEIEGAVERRRSITNNGKLHGIKTFMYNHYGISLKSLLVCSSPVRRVSIRTKRKEKKAIITHTHTRTHARTHAPQGWKNKHIYAVFTRECETPGNG